MAVELPELTAAERQLLPSAQDVRFYQEHGWYTGYGPFNNPQISVVVFLEQGNGAGTAAPVGAKIMDYYFNQRNVAQGTGR